MASTIPVEKPAQAPASAGEGSAYTLESLKAHGTRESFWMLLHDKVYDVTAFLDEVCEVSSSGVFQEVVLEGGNRVWSVKRKSTLNRGRASLASL